jgi:hypothetical protein
MSRVVVLRIQSDSFLAAVVRDAGALVIEAAASGPLAEGASTDDHGRFIASALGDDAPHRAPTVVAIPRTELYWQNFDLPPAPADDLPDLVYLQAQRDLPLPDDGAGFDFIPLEGDDQHPHRVVGVGLLPAQLDRIRHICEAAGLKLERIVPEPLGWPELSRRLTANLREPPHPLAVFASITGRQAVVWATQQDSLRLIRTIWLSDDIDLDEQLPVLAGELRRTLMALSQGHAAQQSDISLIYCGERPGEAAERLTSMLSREVRSAHLSAVVNDAAVREMATAAEWAPLAALGGSLAAHRPPVADLLHPRRRPAPPSRKRTYALAVAAAALVALLAAWKGYRDIAEPKAIAAAADAQRQAMAPQLEALAMDEQKAAAIQTWLNESINLLAELDQLGQQLRPKPLDAADFKADEDVVVTKLTVTGQQIALEAAARAATALPPVENRLRAANYTADRGAIDPASKAVPGYGVGVTALLRRADAAEAATAPGGQP